MSTTQTDTDTELRRTLNEQLLILVGRVRQHFKELAAEAGLSLLQARVLGLLRRSPRSARELADKLQLDPSNITSVVDKLEEAGLLRRELQVGDRRVKLLVLTDEGQQRATDLRARLGEHNPVVDALTARQQQALAELLASALPDTDS
jgi:DNA-binding MarR family transcriptional regulator